MTPRSSGSLSRARTLRIVFALLAIVAVVLGAAHTAPVRALVLRHLIAELRSSAGLDLQASRLSYSVLTLSATLENVRLAAVDTPSQPLATAERIGLTLGPRALRGEVDLRRLELSSPAVTIRRSVDGSSNLPRFGTSNAGGPLRLPAIRADDVDVAIVIGETRVEMAGAVLDLGLLSPGHIAGTIRAPRGLRVAIRDLTVDVASAAVAVDLDGQRLAVRDLVVSRPGTTLHANGTVGLRGAQTTADLAISGTTDLATWEAATDVLDGVQGDVNVRGNIRGPLTDLVVTMEADSQALARSATRLHTVGAGGTYRGGTFTLDRFAARLGGGSVAARGVAVVDGSDRSRIDVRWAGVDFGQLLGPTPYARAVAGNGSAIVEWRHDAAPGVMRVDALATTGLTAGGDTTPMRLKATGVGDRWQIEARSGESAQWTADAAGGLRLDSSAWLRSPLSGRVRFSTMDAGSLAQRLRALGVPMGELDLARVSGSLDLDVTLAGTLGRVRATGRARAQSLAGAGLPPVDVESSFTADVGQRRSTGTFSLTAPTLNAVDVTGQPDVTVRGSLAATGSWEGRLNAPEISATISGRDLAVTMAGTQSIAASSGRFEGRIEGPLSAFQGKGRLTIGALDVGGRALGPLEADLTVDGRTLAVKARASDVQASVEAALAIESPWGFRGRADIAPMDLSRLARFAGAVSHADVSGEIGGALDFTGALNDRSRLSATFASLPLSASVVGVPIVLERGVRASLSAGLLRLEDVGARIGDLAVRLGGEMRTDAPMASVSVDLGGDLAALSPWFAKLAGESAWSTAGRIAGRLEARRSPAGVSVAGTVESTIDRVARGDETVAHDVRLSLALTGSQAELRELTGTALGGPVTARARAPLAWANDRLPEGWRIASVPGEGSGTLEASGDFDAATIVDRLGLKPAHPISGHVTVAAELTATQPSLTAMVGAIRFDRAEVTTLDTTLAQTEPTRLRLAEGRVTIESLTWQAPGSRLSARGQLDLARAFDTDVHVDLEADLGALRAVLPGRTAGTVAGSVDLGGVPGAWRVGADVRLADASVLIPRQGFLVEGWSGRVQLTDDAMSLSEVKGRINGGTVTVDGRLSLKPGDVGQGPRADGIVLVARDILLNVPKGLHSQIGANLQWRPVATGATIDGTVTITAGRYTEPITSVMRLVDSLEGATGGRGASTLPAWLGRPTFAIAIGLTDPLVIENSLGAVELVSDLRLVGTLDAPALSGRVTVVDDGRIRIAGRTFRVRESHLQFAPATGLEPTLDVVGETRVGEYDVTLRVSGTPGQIETTFESSPPLSERDLRSLLVTGTTGTTGREGEGDFAVSAATSDILGFAGKFVGLDSVRLGAVDLDLARRDASREQHLTVTKSLGRYELIFSDNLETGAITWAVIWKPRVGYEVRVVSIENEIGLVEVRHLVSFGPGLADVVTKPDAGARPAAGEVREVVFGGRPGFSEDELMGAVRLEPGRRFDVRRWIDDRIRLQRFFEKRGFHRARIVPTRAVEPGTAGGQSWSLRYDIERGPRTVVESSGDPLPSSIVAEMYETWRGVPIADLAVAEFERIAREGMARRGYHRSVVRVVLAADTSELARAVVHLERGRQTNRQIVEWHGNSAASQSELDALTAARQVESSNVDLEAVAWDVEQLYASRGYLGSTVTFSAPTFDEDVATVRARIDEGPRHRLADLRVEGVAPERRDGARSAIGFAADDAFVPTLPAEAAKRLRTFYANQGYRDVTVSRVVERQAPDALAMTLTVVEGPPSVVKGVRVEGVESTNAGLVRDAITLDRGAVASQESADTTRRNLYAIGTFRRVDVRFEPTTPEMTDGRSLVDLAIDAQEPRRYQVRYGVLVSTDHGLHGGDGETGLGGSLELRDRNFLGRAFQASAGGHYTPNLQTLSFLFASPRTFGSPVRTNVYARERREQFNGESSVLSSLERDVTLDQRWRPTPTTELAWGYQFIYRLFRLEQGEARTEFPGNLTGPTFSFIIDRRDSPFDATRGWFHSSSVQLGVKPLGSDLGYVRYLTRQSVYSRIGWLTVAGSARLGVLQGYSGTAPVSVLDLFFLAGGTNSVRGYKAGSLSAVTVSDYFLGGTRLVVLNGEIRFPIVGRVSGAAFVDGGNTFLATRGIALDRLAVGSGFGLRISTPLAPLRLDVAYPVTEGFGPQRLRFHFSIGQMF